MGTFRAACACAHAHKCPPEGSISALKPNTACNSLTLSNSCVWQPLSLSKLHTHTHKYVNKPQRERDAWYWTCTWLVCASLRSELLSLHSKRHQWHAENGCRKMAEMEIEDAVRVERRGRAAAPRVNSCICWCLPILIWVPVEGREAGRTEQGNMFHQTKDETQNSRR